MTKQIFKNFSLLLISMIFFLISAVSQNETLVSPIDSLHNQKIDSIRFDLENDSSKTSLIYFEVDYLNTTGYGCVIYCTNNYLRGYKFEIKQNRLIRFELNQVLLEKNSDTLKTFFIYPDKFLFNFPPSSENKYFMGHDTKRQLFLEVNGKTIFDRWFTRSSSVLAKDERIFKVLLELGALSSQ